MVYINSENMACLTQCIGGSGGSAFNFSGLDNGATLKKIQVWVGGWQIRSIQVWLTDGRTKQFGKTSGNPSEFTFEDGERFTSLSLWENGKEEIRTGAIKFKTSKSREFFVKMTEFELQTEYPIDVGSGICMGILGREGGDIDSLAFIFLNTIKSAVLKDVKYPTLNSVIPKVDFEETKSILQNPSTVKQKYTVETSKALTKMYSWNVANKMELLFHIQVQAGVPEVVEASSGYSFTLGKEIASAIVSTEEITEPVSFTVDVPPGKTMDVAIKTGRFLIDLPYTGTVQVTCNNGTTQEFKTEETYKGLAFTQAKIEVKESQKQLK